MTDDWKDAHREHKEATGLSWDAYHGRHFVHVDDLDDLETTIAELSEHVDAVTREYRDMKRELHELKVMLQSEEYEP